MAEQLSMDHRIRRPRKEPPYMTKSAICPAALQQAFERRGFIINQLELMAVLCCLLTYGELVV
jgi:hypothetical protein